MVRLYAYFARDMPPAMQAHMVWDKVEYIIKDMCYGCPDKMKEDLMTYAVNRIYRQEVKQHETDRI